jgi:hypothetical protein
MSSWFRIQILNPQLVDYGLLQHLGNGVYVITDIGEEYLEGELDAADLEGPDEG